jgi:hypothetical protein
MPRRTQRKPGRPSLLTPERQARLFEIVKKGNHLTTACAVVGIGTSTMYRWLEEADNAEALQTDGKPLTDAQRVYLEFRDGLRLARAHAEMRAVSVIERSMEGGFVISERPIQDSNGDVKYGPDGEILWERTFTQPDGRLALNYLARSSPAMWGQQAAGSPGMGGTASGDAADAGGSGLSDNQAAVLSQQLAAVVARRAQDAEQDRLELEEGIQDAELVQDEAG